MPWVTINMISGHAPEKKQALHQKVAEAIYGTLGIPPEWVKIQIVEMKDEDHSIGGTPINELSEK